MDTEVMNTKIRKNRSLFSKALFKQSCKANGMMWLIITVAVCFMLACVMLISGTSSISSVKENIEGTIIEEAISSSVSKAAISVYDETDAGEYLFDKAFVEKFEEINTPENYRKVAEASMQTGTSAEDVMMGLYVKPAYEAAANAVIEKYTEESAAIVAINPSNKADSVYTENGETVPSEYIEALLPYLKADVLATGDGEKTDSLSEYVDSEERTAFRNERAYEAASMLVAQNMTSDDTVDELLDALADYNVTREGYDKMGFDYEKVHTIAYEASMEYQDKLAYETAQIGAEPGSEAYNNEVASIKEALNVSVAGSLLEKLPEDVADGLEELGRMDLYGLIVGSIFFKMAGLLLPIIYLIMASNNLIAGQVDTGSMAYVLSTSTKRRQVTFTQGVFLVGSLLLMILCTAITSVVCFGLTDVQTNLTNEKLLQINLGAFVVLFAMSGLNFLASCWFDRSKKAMALGGGISIFFLVATMLGLFGSPVIPSVVRIGALNNFNYVSIISLFDVISILNQTNDWIWKLGILLVIGAVGYLVGSIRFRRKDLPL